MSESRLFKAYSQGCARSLEIRLSVAIVVISGFACLALAVGFAPIDPDTRIFIWIGLVVLFLLIILGAIITWAVWLIRSRAEALDQAFLPLGLEGRSYLINSRQYHGAYRGYTFHIYIYRGPTLQIYLDVPLNTRVSIGRKGVLERIAAATLQKDTLEVQDSAFDHLAVYPADPHWAGVLLADRAARQAILQLTSEEAATELRALSLTPQALLLQSRFIPLKNITPEVVQTLVAGLTDLARITAGLAPPSQTDQESSLEQKNRMDRGKFTRPIVAITCGFFIIMIICILALSAVLIPLTQSGL